MSCAVSTSLSRQKVRLSQMQTAQTRGAEACFADTIALRAPEGTRPEWRHHPTQIISTNTIAIFFHRNRTLRIHGNVLSIHRQQHGTSPSTAPHLCLTENSPHKSISNPYSNLVQSTYSGNVALPRYFARARIRWQTYSIPAN